MFLALSPVFELAQSQHLWHLLLMDSFSGVEFRVVHRSHGIALSWKTQSQLALENVIAVVANQNRVEDWKAPLFEYGMTLRGELRGSMKLPERRTPDLLGPVRHSFILDIFGSCLFPLGWFCPDVASGVEQGLASFPHGSTYFYWETNKGSLGVFFTGPGCIEPLVVLGSFLK